jgi:hypothetical protein
MLVDDEGDEGDEDVVKVTIIGWIIQMQIKGGIIRPVVQM